MGCFEVVEAMAGSLEAGATDCWKLVLWPSFADGLHVQIYLREIAGLVHNKVSQHFLFFLNFWFSQCIQRYVYTLL